MNILLSKILNCYSIIPQLLLIIPGGLCIRILFIYICSKEIIQFKQVCYIIRLFQIKISYFNLILFKNKLLISFGLYILFKPCLKIPYPEVWIATGCVSDKLLAKATFTNKTHLNTLVVLNSIPMTNK